MERELTVILRPKGAPPNSSFSIELADMISVLRILVDVVKEKENKKMEMETVRKRKAEMNFIFSGTKKKARKFFPL